MEITGFWDALPERTRDALRQAGTSVTKKPGTLLTREHTHTSQVFILHSGAVKVWVDRAGDAAILDVLGPGDLVGELEAVDGGVRHANVEVLTQVRATVLTADRFRRVLDAHPARHGRSPPSSPSGSATPTNCASRTSPTTPSGGWPAACCA